MDDSSSDLPLSIQPNKTLQFSELTNGSIFEKNLNLGLKAAVRSYDEYFLKHFFDEQKGKLDEAVGAMHDTDRDANVARPSLLKDCQLTTFSNYFRRRLWKVNYISVP